MGNLFLTKEARIYNGAKTASSVKDRKYRNKPMHLWVTLTKEARICNGAKTASSVNGKTGQLHVEE